MTEQPRLIVDRVIARLEQDAMLSNADGRAAVIRVLSVTMRPFSIIARVEIESGTARRRVIVKFPRLKPGKPDLRVARLEHERATAQTLAAMFKGHSGLGVADVVAFYPEIPALIWAEVDGMTLEEMTRGLACGLPGREGMARLEGAFHRTGRWLRTLQTVTQLHGGTLSLDEMIDYVDLRLCKIMELAPGLGEPWRASVHAAFKAARLGSADLRLAAVHGDFSLSNVMYDGRVVAIDFSRFGTGSVYYDVSRLYHQLGLLLHKPWFLPATVTRLQRALLAGYDPGLHPDQPAFRLFLIQHLLCHWQGLLKRSAALSWPARHVNRWAAHRHRRELERLIQPHRDTRSEGRAAA
jgi:hypothetical protein